MKNKFSCETCRKINTKTQFAILLIVSGREWIERKRTYKYWHILAVQTCLSFQLSCLHPTWLRVYQSPSERERKNKQRTSEKQNKRCARPFFPSNPEPRRCRGKIVKVLSFLPLAEFYIPLVIFIFSRLTFSLISFSHPSSRGMIRGAFAMGNWDWLFCNKKITLSLCRSSNNKVSLSSRDLISTSSLFS